MCLSELAGCSAHGEIIAIIRLVGDEGRIENYGDVSRPDSPATIHLWNRRVRYQHQGNQVFEVPVMEGTHGGADRLMIDDFVSFLLHGISHGAMPEDARQAAATCILGADSLRQNGKSLVLSH